MSALLVCLRKMRKKEASWGLLSYMVTMAGGECSRPYSSPSHPVQPLRPLPKHGCGLPLNLAHPSLPPIISFPLLLKPPAPPLHSLSCLLASPASSSHCPCHKPTQEPATTPHSLLRQCLTSNKKYYHNTKEMVYKWLSNSITNTHARPLQLQK